MKKVKFIDLFFVIVLFISFGSCNTKETLAKPDKIDMRYIEQICCGNLMTLNNFMLSGPCESYKDSLLRAINLDEFDIPQNYQFGDILSIEYKLTEDCEASCEITCNRMNGIPIEIISVK